MRPIRRSWTPREADEWSREDWYAIVLAPIGYVGIILSVTFCFLLKWYGFVLLAASAGVIGLMHWIIDPKLSAISEEYEKRQDEYLRELERKNRWENPS